MAFAVASLMAVSTLRHVPANLVWLSKAARSAARKTGGMVGGALLDHYSEAVREISRAGFTVLAWVVPAGIAATSGYGALLHFYTNAYAPFVDSAVLVFSIVAQLLLMQRKIETWVFWLLVNSIAILLYASRGLTLTSILYAAYWINAVVSWVVWRRWAR